MDPFQVLELATAASAESENDVGMVKNSAIITLYIRPPVLAKKTKSHRYEVGEPLVGSISSRESILFLPSETHKKKRIRSRSKGKQGEKERGSQWPSMGRSFGARGGFDPYYAPRGVRSGYGGKKAY